jgi:hypothetical protein
MFPHSKNQIPLQDFKHPAPGDEIVIKRLGALGFVLEEKEFSFGESNFNSRVDFIFRRGRRKYAIEVKQSRKIQLVLSHLLPRGILLLQAARRLSGYIPIVAVVVEKLDQRDIRRIAEFIRHFAPEVGWLLVDKYGGGAFKDPEKDDYGILPPLNHQPLMPGGSLESKSYFSAHNPRPLSFSDLDQWLLKVFLLGHPGIAADYWGGPQGIVQNAFQLSKLSGVSPPISNFWFNAMESSGYLKRIGRKEAILLKPNSLIEEWRGQYRFADNRILPYRSMYPVSEDDEYFQDILGRIKSCNEDAVPLAISAHQACKQFGIKHSSAKSIHIYFWGDIGLVANSLNLVPAEAANEASVFLVEPKYPKSVFGGRVVRRGIPICDILQCYLDLFNLPDRGREQADFVYENILFKLFEKGRLN